MTHSHPCDTQRDLHCGDIPATPQPLSPQVDRLAGCPEIWAAVMPSARKWIDILALFPAGFDRYWIQAALGLSAALLHELQQHGVLRLVGEARLQWVNDFRQQWLADLTRRQADALAAHYQMAALMMQRMQQFEPLLNGGHLEATLPELDLEWLNITAALDWIIQSDEPQLGLSMIIPVARYCLLRGRAREGGEYIDAVLSLSSLTTTYEFVQVMLLSGELQEAQSNLEDALDRYQTAFTLTTLPNSEYDELTALALLGLSRIHRRQNLREHALCYAQKAVELAQAVRNTALINRARRELRNIIGDGEE